jgi:uracil-DNA glycosylase
MRLDEDYLREMELWPVFEMRGKSQPVADSPDQIQAPASVAVTYSPTPMEMKTVAPKIETPRPRGVEKSAEKTAAKPVSPPQPSMPVDPARVVRIGTLDFNALALEAAACNACGLCKQRKQAVIGVGAHDAPWLFVGEGPGADEDQQGEPFVGQAGKLLDAMLNAAGLARGREVYIANVVKCRPPGNRTPTVDEAAACAPFLDRQIDLIKPKLIVALGKTAVTRLTGSDASMASLRGQSLEYRGIPVIATYHPAYLLRNLPEKLKAWEDLIFARQKMAVLASNVTNS